MEFWTVALISLAAGLVLVIGGALVVYMGSLVKSAYELKVEIKSEVEDGQRKVEEEVDKKLRWIKRELVEEVEKIKSALLAENQRRVTELTAGIEARIADYDEALRRDRAETAKLLEGLRRDVMILDQRWRLMRREQKTAAKEETSGEVATPTGGEAAAEPSATPTEAAASAPSPTEPAEGPAIP